MSHLLNLISAIALLVWGTSLVRTGVLEVFGENLRSILARSFGTRPAAALAGVGVTALVQSSTATALIVSSFVGQGLVSLPTALAAMLGADVGTSLMSVVFSFDLAWLSPLLILAGVVLFVSRQATMAGRIGRVLIGLGLMLLALRLISESAGVMARTPVVNAILASLSSDVLLEITVGAALALAAYSSLAVVLLTAALAGSGAISLDVAIGLTLGANLGGGLLAVLVTAKSSVQVRQVPLGNLLFKLAGVAAAAPFAWLWLHYAQPYIGRPETVVVVFHLSLNLLICALFIGLAGFFAAVVRRLLPIPEAPGGASLAQPMHLDPTALATPSLAISCASREALRQADIVETMLRGIPQVIRDNDLKLGEDLRKLDDTVDELYSAIKYYLTKISRQALDEKESRRWSDIISFTISMEQIGDTVERVILDLEEKKIRKGRSFSDAGMVEIHELHKLLTDNLRLSMSVFLTGSVRDAHKLIEEKTRFRDLERAYAETHLTRLSANTLQSIETSSLHLDLISDLKRINSLICSIAYPILDNAGVLSPSRLRPLDGSV